MPKLRTPWRAVTAMFVLNGALFGIWASRIPTIALNHQLGPGNLGMLLLLLAAGAITAFPLAGRSADRFGAAGVTWWVAIAYTIALLLIAIAPNYLTLAIALFIFGATHGAMDVAMNTWASEVERHIGRPVMSSFHAMFSLGAGVGAGSGYLAATASLAITSHFFIAGVSVAAITLALAKIDWTSEASKTSRGGPAFLLPKGPLVAVGFVAFCASLGEGAMADWSAVFLVLTTGATEARAALGYTVFSLAMVGMRLLGDSVIRTFGPTVSARLAGGTAGIGVLCAVLFGTYSMALVGFVLMGLGYAVIMPLAFSRAANDPTITPGTAIASVATLGYGGLLLGPPLIGFVAEVTTIRTAFLILAALSVAIIALAKTVAPAKP